MLVHFSYSEKLRNVDMRDIEKERKEEGNGE